ncbi:hypothetical protein QYE76_064951 [Lolium multiflorum]|uniref:Reverse transcriptase zinc-binding domain-containing protein n=1 Tax=Lolium multiflorum TaxID=4521 RepID=A0AAD8W879_LOLMU|nr:hypothetical protein QYE76_064951 [Lolium multiflorum]
MLSWCGLPHPASCPFCDQGGETLDHLLMGCVLTREVWAVFLRLWGKLRWMPQPDTTLVSWLQEKKGGVSKNGQTPNHALLAFTTGVRQMLHKVTEAVEPEEVQWSNCREEVQSLSPRSGDVQGRPPVQALAVLWRWAAPGVLHRQAACRRSAAAGERPLSSERRRDCQYEGQLSDCTTHGHAHLCPGQPQIQQASSSLTQSTDATSNNPGCHSTSPLESEADCPSPLDEASCANPSARPSTRGSAGACYRRPAGRHDQSLGTSCSES